MELATEEDTAMDEDVVKEEVTTIAETRRNHGGFTFLTEIRDAVKFGDHQ
jgi:hypothetical protein